MAGDDQARVTAEEIRSAIGFAVLVGLFEYGGLVLAKHAGLIATIWPANGVLLAALLTSRRRAWLAYFSLGIAANLLAAILAGYRTDLWARIVIINGSEVLAALLLLRRFLGEACDLSQPASLWRFALIASIASPAVAVLVNAGGRQILQGTVSGPALLASFLAHSLGIITITPVVLAARRGELSALFQRRSLIKSLVVVTVLLAVTIGVFMQSRYPLLFMLLPPLVLAVYLGGFAGGTLALFLVTLISITFTMAGRGPAALVLHVSTIERILVVQTFAVVAATLVLVLSMVVVQRDRAMDELRKAKDRLAALATIDGLTGLANRRKLDEDLERECQRARRSQAALSLVLLDADQFKAFNDHYGHQAGDRFLISLAAVLQAKVQRLSDICARYGGEEFALLLPDTDETGAMRVAETARRAIEALAIPHLGNPGGIATASFGVATAHGRSARTTPAGLIGAADAALYEAKRQGRNRVVLAGAAVERTAAAP